MFGDRQFQELYQTLSLNMVDVDCGIECGKFCCVGDGQTDYAFKYLLPGEIDYLVQNNFHEHAVLEDFGFLIHFRSGLANTCPCQTQRNFRPFCCRVFPFRPVIDVDVGRVSDLVKTNNVNFSPCWITAALPTWREQAIKAWNLVLIDRTNRQFYARYAYCLEQSEKSELSYYQALEQDEQFRNNIRALDTADDRELWRLCARFFQK